MDKKLVKLKDRLSYLNNLSSTSEKFDSNHMLKLLPMLKRLGDYYGRYGHEGYSWVDRQSFADMDKRTHYELRLALNEAIGQAEIAVQQKILNGGFDPADCWAKEEILSSGIRYIERYNHKVLLSSISLWFWTKFTGKEILVKLNRKAITGGFKSEHWKVTEKAIVNIYKYSTDTQSLNRSCKELGRFLKHNVVDELVRALSKGNFSLEFLLQMQLDLENDFDELAEMDSMIAHLDATEPELLEILLREFPVIPNATLGSLWEEVVEKAFLLPE